ncbi:MAG: ABC transporter ATP-binding protein [Clostridia bacterium]|nr:ABC transporter ATP-binding protein [Clostridia bacterium]
MKKDEIIFDERFTGTLTVSKVSKFYGDNNEVKALDGVSLQFFTGQFVVILGASGSGKSTLLNLIGGMDMASEGEINIGGVDITQLSPENYARYRREVVGFIFQFYNLMPNLTALENVQIAEIPGEMKAEEALELVGLSDKHNNFPSELSGGEQQRVSIARAIVKNPTVLLCDEPTGALDSKTGKRIIKLLQDVNKNKDKIVVVVTHNSAFAEIADRVIRISDGKIISDVTQKNPKSIEEIEL